MSINFKTVRIRNEYIQLHNENRDLFNLIDETCMWVSNNLQKDITITSIYRTKEENDALYAKTPKDQWPKHQPHCEWKAVDLRSYDFEPKELEAICTWINKTYPNPLKRTTAFVHEVAGNTYHFHIQYKLGY